MHRRNFLSSLAGTVCGLASQGNGSAAEQKQDDTVVKRVLVMFKCHLDVGFVDTQSAIIKKYFGHSSNSGVHRR